MSQLAIRPSRPPSRTGPSRAGSSHRALVVQGGSGPAIVVGLIVIVAASGGFIYGFVNGGEPTSLGTMFGRPYDELPADFRSGIETRLKAVAPADWDRLNVPERAAWAVGHTKSGMVRLDHSTLIRRFRLGSAAESRVAVADCAANARPSTLSRATDEAFQSALSVDERKERVEIDLEAIEADVHETPVPRTVTEDEAKGLWTAMMALATPEESRAIEASGGPFTSDAVVCAYARAVRAVALRLPAADLATLVRFSYQP